MSSILIFFVVSLVCFDSSCTLQDPLSDFSCEPELLTAATLNGKIKSVYDYRCVVTGLEQQILLISLGVSFPGF